MICPQCGGSKRKEVTDRLESKYSVCANCGYSLTAVQEFVYNGVDLTRLLEEADMELLIASEVLLEAKRGLNLTQMGARDYILKAASVKVADRGYEQARLKIRALTAVAELVACDETGTVTFALPSLGLLYQVVWGAEDPLVVINSTLNAHLATGVETKPVTKPHRRRN